MAPHDPGPGNGSGPHHHPHDHGHDHTHGHGHTHGHSHGPGHNHSHPDHLHSHMDEADEAAELQVLTAQFIDGFVKADDKMAYLRLTGVPLELDGEGDKPSLKLVDVQLKTEWQVGTASPSFGSRELSYLPFPGEMVKERVNMFLVYVSLEERREMDLRGWLQKRP